MGELSGKVRLDKWLWAARFYKTRTQSATAIKNGRVSVRDVRAKASQQVSVGTQLTVRKGPYRFQLEVIALADRRGNAELARTLYTESDESVRERESVYNQLAAARSKASGPRAGARPTKKQRRALDAFRSGYSSPEEVDDDWNDDDWD